MNKLSLDSQVEIISVHVHKTAGGTFGRVLKQIYGESQLFSDYQGENLETVLVKLLAQPQARVIHGHFPAEKYQEHFSSAKRIIWLRNPIIQFISGYFFWKSQSQKGVVFSEEHKSMLDNNMSLLEFAEFRATHFINPLANFYCRGVDLTDFYFVGVQEFFQDDLAELKQMLGWPDFKMEVFNQNKYPNYLEHLKEALEDKKLLNKLIAMNRQDLQLYQTALDLRAKRKKLSNSWEQYELDLKLSQQKLQQIQGGLERKQSLISKKVALFN
ncbi:sulfotransferase family 2 domain-containing protein [Microcoleus vaginatus]|uniref:sulfotransferase family 2 domain-containing protein n=1 Tax=Microcoleus vaginatus TaxID=119532 RepID=UPI0032AC3B9B